MKKVLAALIAVVILTGCTMSGDDVSRAIALRERIMKSKGCTFLSVVTADYGDKIYEFTLDCKTDSLGNLTFIVEAPVSIKGIQGTISAEGGNLTFDDQILAFDTLADGMITPVSAPWVLMNTLRGGYLSACGADGAYLKVLLDDSYKEEALRVEVWLDTQDQPVRTEILWKGTRVLSLDVKNFAYL